MDTKKLRQKVLDLAIHGKLVPQDPNDEPASVLLDRIRAEKKRLVEEGKIKKSDLIGKPISEDEIPFEVPEGWVLCRLGDLVMINPRNQADDNLDAAFIPMAYIDPNLLNTFRYDVKKWGQIKSGFTHLQDNDVVFAKITPCITNRKAAIMHDLPNGIGGGTTELNVFRVYGDTINRFYLLYYLASEYFLHKASYKGTAGQQRIETKYVVNKPFPLPPLSEQHRIVKAVDELFEQIDVIERSEADLKEAADKAWSKVLNLAIQGRLVTQDPNEEPASVLLEKIRAEKARLVKEGKLKKKDLEEKPISPDEIPFDIPEGWEWCRIGDIITLINGRAYKKEELLEKGKYKVLRVGNFFTNQSWYYSDLELEEDKYCYNGDLLYAWSASFGPKIWDGDKTIFHYHIWNVKFDERLLYRDYLYYFFMYDVFHIKSSTTGSTMIHVAMENMKPRFIPLPPLSEQHRIVAKLEEILPKLKSMNRMTDR